MPRKRMIWPGYFESEQMANLSLEACRTFEGFWCFADDRGRMKRDADQLWADVWIKRRKVDHVTIDDVETHLDALVSNGQLCEYQVGGQAFLHAISWDEHQKINHPTPSKLPPCEEHHQVDWLMWWRDDDTATQRWRAAEKSARAAALDSGSGSLNASPETEEGLTRNRGVTPSQCSSVQVSSDQAAITESSRVLRQFPRPSQQRRTS